MYKKIICPIDGSPTSDCGMVEAIQLAKDQNARLLFLHVTDNYFPMLDVTGDLNVVYISEILRNNGKKVIKKAESNALAAGVHAETKIIEGRGGRIAKFVLSQVEEWCADLIVMGTHGLRGIERLVIGSDAETVVRSTSVPVLLVRNKPQARIKPQGKHLFP